MFTLYDKDDHSELASEEKAVLKRAIQSSQITSTI